MSRGNIKNDDSDRNSRYRGVRRQAQHDSQARSSARSRRGRQRHLSVRSELRDQPDANKIARAVIQMTLAQAEAEAAEEARQHGDSQPNRGEGAQDV